MCDCIAKNEKLLKSKVIEILGCDIGHVSRAGFNNKVFPMKGNKLSTAIVLKFGVTYQKYKKNSEPYANESKLDFDIAMTYCPFCGEKYETENDSKPKDILMSTDNPKGWKLEDLLEQIGNELACKNSKISGSTHLQRDMIMQNNCELGGLLRKAKAIQVDTMAQLDAVEPNKEHSHPRL